MRVEKEEEELEALVTVYVREEDHYEGQREELEGQRLKNTSPHAHSLFHLHYASLPVFP